MLEVDPPTDPSLWSDHLFFRLDRLIEQLLKSDTDFDCKPSYHSEVFLPSFLREIKRVARMKDGERYAISLLVNLKVAYLSLPDDMSVALYQRDRDRDEMHRAVDVVFGTILKSVQRHPLNIYVRNRRLDPPWIDAAQMCRTIARCLDESICPHLETGEPEAKIGCVQGNIVHMQSRLQRYASVEIKVNVYRAVGKHLPKELADLVFQHTLVAEEVPHHPRRISHSSKASFRCGAHKLWTHCRTIYWTREGDESDAPYTSDDDLYIDGPRRAMSD
jgi:hypothetical protein